MLFWPELNDSIGLTQWPYYLCDFDHEVSMNLPSTKLKPTITDSTTTAMPVSSRIALQNGDIF